MYDLILIWRLHRKDLTVIKCSSGAGRGRVENKILFSEIKVKTHTPACRFEENIKLHGQ
jgi:hypothetical protein